MYPNCKLIKNENGSVIVVALLLLVFLTIIGLTATSNSRIESNVTLNSQIYKRDFYVADSGWRTAAIDLNDPPAKFPLVKTKLAALDNRDNDGDGTVDEAGEKYAPLNDSDLMRNTVFDYTAQGPWGDPERAVGSSGAMNCANVIFKVDSKSENFDPKNGTWSDSQNISARLIKLCCAGY